MLSPIAKTLLKELLTLLAVPEHALGPHELMGFMFGLAILPEPIPDEEWLPAVCGESLADKAAVNRSRTLRRVLKEIHAVFLAEKQRDALQFPYRIETLMERDLEDILKWVAGFDEALALRPEIWEPEIGPDFSRQQQEEVFFSMLVIQGLVDPVEIMSFFEELPDDVFADAFVSFTPQDDNRELQVQAFLLATLPLAVQTLQEHAASLEASTPISPAPRPSVFPHPASMKSDGAGRNKKKSGKLIRVSFPERNERREKDRPINTVPLYQLKIALHRARPPIWRRLLVPGNLTLAELHTIFQLCMGWDNSHHHQFMIGDTFYAPRQSDNWNIPELRNEAEYTLHSIAPKIDRHFEYIYDFADNWVHKVTIEEVLEPHPGRPGPVLLKGKRACPPEDVGGIHSYMQFLEAFKDPRHEEHQSVIRWVDPRFQPELFDEGEIAEINEQLAHMFP